MKIVKVPLFHGVLLLTVGFMLSLVATASWAGGRDDPKNSEACFETTELMEEACSADIFDDLLTESAKCLNSEDVKGCQREVKRDYRKARKDCRYQAGGRNDLCERLPNAGPYIMEVDPENFDDCEDGNPFYPLVVGTVTTFVNEEDDGEIIVVTVTDETREIAGVETIVVRDTVYEGLDFDGDGNPTGDRIEDTDDYYAIADNCDVWYFGEVSQSFEEGYLESLEGSFITDVDGAQAGIIMLGNPMVGDVYRQEFALGDAEDAAEVLLLATDIYDEDGRLVVFDNSDWNCNGACLLTEDFIANDPDGTEFKYFKAGIGFVAEQLPEGEVVLKLVKVEVLP